MECYACMYSIILTFSFLNSFLWSSLSRIFKCAPTSTQLIRVILLIKKNKR